MRTLTLALLLVGTASLGAQEPPDSTRADTLPHGPDFRIRGLTVAVPRPLATAGGASAIEVRLDSVSPQPAPTLADVLRAMPLVQIRTNSRGEAQPALRGAEDRQIAILVDGVPLSLGWDARTDLSVIPVTAARRIRLVRGLATILYGPNVLGGAVEVDVARGPEDFAPPEPITLHIGADHTGGSSMAVTGGRLSEGATGQWEVRAGAGFQDRRGLSLPGGFGRDPTQRARFAADDAGRRLNSDSRRFDGFASLRYRADGGAWFSASGAGYEVERGVPPEAHVDEPRLWRYPFERRFILALSGGTGFHDTTFGSGDLEASVGIDLGRTEIDAYATEAYRNVVGGEDADDRTVTFRTTGDLGIGERTDLRAAVTFADVLHEEVIDEGPVTDYQQRLWSLGAEVEQRLGHLPSVPGLGVTRLTLGVAVDGSDTPTSGDKPPLGRLWDWGARVGVSSLSTGGRVLYHASVSRRTRFPALRELYSGALGRFEPNPGLSPEVLVAGELGLTYTGSWSTFQVVGFHQRLSDAIVRTSIQTAQGPRFKRVNRDRIRSTGLELLASARLGSLALTGDLTAQHVRGGEAGGPATRLEYEPQIFGRLGLNAGLPGELLGSADLSYVGSQYCENPEVGGLEAFDSNPRLDVGLRRGFRLRGRGALQRLEAKVALANVGDALVFDQCGLPQPGRTLSLQMRLW